MFCTECGSKLYEGAHYCAGCGASVSTGTESESAPPSAGPKRGAGLLVVVLIVFVLAVSAAGLLLLGGSDGRGSDSNVWPPDAQVMLADAFPIPVPSPVAESAEARWEFADLADWTPGPMAAGANQESVFVVSGDTDSQQADVVAFERSSGEVVWEVDITRELEESEPQFAVVEARDDVILVSVRTEMAAITIALDPASGHEMWKSEGIVGPHSTPEVILQIGPRDASTFAGEIHTVEPTTGELIWRTDAERYVIWDDRLFVAHDGTLRSMSVDAGEVIWEVPVYSQWADITAADGLVALSEAPRGASQSTIDSDGITMESADRVITVFSAETGESLWERDETSAHLVGLGEHIGVVADDLLRVYDPRGEEVWSHDLAFSEEILTVIITSYGSRLLVWESSHGGDGSITMLDGENGQELGEIVASGSLYDDFRRGTHLSILQISDNIMTVRDDDTIRAFSTRDFEELWSVSLEYSGAYPNDWGFPLESAYLEADTRSNTIVLVE